MHTISLKFPPQLEHLVEAEAKRRQTSKSAIIRACVEEVLLKSPNGKRQLICADLAGDLIGSLQGPSDLSSNKQYLEDAILEDDNRPERGELARRLCGMGSHLAPGRDLAAELDEEREREDLERMKALGG